MNRVRNNKKGPEFVLQNILTGYLIFQKNCYYDYNNTKQLQFFV